MAGASCILIQPRHIPSKNISDTSIPFPDERISPQKASLAFSPVVVMYCRIIGIIFCLSPTMLGRCTISGPCGCARDVSAPTLSPIQETSRFTHRKWASTTLITPFLHRLNNNDVRRWNNRCSLSKTNIPLAMKASILDCVTSLADRGTKRCTYMIILHVS